VSSFDLGESKPGVLKLRLATSGYPWVEVAVREAAGLGDEWRVLMTKPLRSRRVETLEHVDPDAGGTFAVLVRSGSAPNWDGQP
jgi:hypothetical protein